MEHPAKLPGQIVMRLVTEHDVDWPTLLTLLRSAGADLEVLHADAPARNLDDLRRTEADSTTEDQQLRRSAWQQMLTHDAETRALRAVMPLLQRLAPGAGNVQDPRLLDVARIVQAEEAFWSTAIGSGTPPIAARAEAAPANAQDLAEARLRLGQRRWIVARTAFAQVRQQCDEVAAHAAAVADRTMDARVAGRYRALAADCRAAAQAIDAVFAK